MRSIPIPIPIRAIRVIRGYFFFKKGKQVVWHRFFFNDSAQAVVVDKWKTMMELLMSRVPEQEPVAEALEIQLLVQQTLAGDCSAFERLVLRYERRVMTLSLRFLRDLEEAQDATQEVFLRAFRYVHRFDARRPVEPWLMRITVNVCRDIRRKKQKRHPTFSEVPSAETEPEGETPDPYSGFAREQQRQMLWKALDALPEKERMAVILRDVEGFSTSEVSEILGSSETTVRSQICRGRLKIREAMDQMTGGQR